VKREGNASAAIGLDLLLRDIYLMLNRKKLAFLEALGFRSRPNEESKATF